MIQLHGIDNELESRRSYNQEINRVHLQVRKLASRIIKCTGKRVVLRSELEPMLSEEEKLFIGPYWKSKKAGDGRIYYTKISSLDKILMRKFYDKNSDWKKEQLAKIENGNLSLVPKISFLR